MLEDAIYKRNKKIEEMYNFTIKVDEVGNVADVISKLVQSLMADMGEHTHSCR